MKARIVRLTRQRGIDKSVNPSDTARFLFSETWKLYLDDVRTAAGTMKKEGLFRITHNKRTEIDTGKIKGPIRLSFNND